MTQLSTGTENRTVGTAAAGSTHVEKPRHPGRRLFGKTDPHAPQPMVVPEQNPVVAAESDLWDEGRTAARSGNHERAMECFLSEAEARSKQGSHGRAAIAFRTAAEQARIQGLAEQRDQLLGRAAAAYTQAAERNGLTQEATHQAWISAAKCFLQLQQLDRASWCIERAGAVTGSARSVGETAKAAT